MKKLSSIVGVIALFLLMAVPAFPISLQFDFDGNPNTWEENWIMQQDEEAIIDVWIADYYSSDTEKILYRLELDSAILEVVDAWSYDTDEGGLWCPASCYADLLWRGQRVYQAGNMHCPGQVVAVNGKIKLHSIKIRCLVETETAISLNYVLGNSGPISVIFDEYGQYFPDYFAKTAINEPCELYIEPEKKDVLPGETVQFTAREEGSCKTPLYRWEVTPDCGSTIDAHGVYKAGEVSAPCVDTVTVTDEANEDIEAVATVKIAGPCTVTISPKTATVSIGASKEFTATPSAFCTQDPVYSWSVTSSEGTGTTGNTANTGMPLYTWSRSLEGSTGNTGNTYLFQATSVGDYTVKVVLDKANGNVSDTAAVSVVSTTTTTTIKPPPQDECAVDRDCDDEKFCNGSEKCVKAGGVKKCRSGAKPCPDDGLFCNGAEGCDETNDVCTVGSDPCAPLNCDEENDFCVGCLNDEYCSDEVFCNGEELCVDGVCNAGVPVVCEDNGDFCDGVEICDEEARACVSPGNPCTQPTPVEVKCDEENDRCVEIPPPIDFNLIPDSVPRSHLIPLPLFMFIVSIDGTDFWKTPPNVTFGGDIITPPLTLALLPNVLFNFALINPSGLDTTDSTSMEVRVSAGEGVGTKNLTLIMLPWILENK